MRVILTDPASKRNLTTVPFPRFVILARQVPPLTIVRVDTRLQPQLCPATRLSIEHTRLGRVA
jgi:hypothetical protein